MATQLQLRQGNTAQTAVFTGVIAEVTVDTDQKTLTIHDGTTVGGNYLITKSQLQSNVSIIAGINSTQNTNITAVNGLAAGAYNQANTNAGAITIIQGVDNTQNTRLNSIETVNGNQNTAISIIEWEIAEYVQGVSATQNNRLDGLEGVNLTQNTNITAVNQYAQSSFGVANSALTLAQNAYNYANTISVLTNNTASFSLESNGIIILPAASALYNNTATFSTSTANQIFDTFSTTEYRTAKYLIQGVSGSAVHSTEVILNHNDTNVFMSEYGTVFSTNILFNLDSYIISGNVILDITPVGTDTTIDFFRTSLVARILSGIEGDLMIQSGTEDLNIGSGTEDLNI